MTQETKTDLKILIAITAVSMLAFVLLAWDVGHNIDEHPYIYAGQLYFQWVTDIAKGFFTGDFTLVKERLADPDTLWQFNHEHPPSAKIVYGLFGKIFTPILGSMAGPRTGALFFLLMLQFSLYFLIAPKYGRLAGAVGALAVIAHPRLLVHGIMCGLDMPVAALSALCALAFVRGLESRRWAILCGITYGLAVGAKINGVFLIIPLLIWGYIFYRKQFGENLFWMVTAGPAAFFISWPWMWHNTFPRIIEYLQFHAQHKVEPAFIFGGVFSPAPWQYPVVVLLAATPVVIWIFSAISLKRLLATPIDRYYLLLLALAIFPVLVVTPASVPAYSQLRLYLLTPAMICALSGIGLSIMVEKALAIKRYKIRKEWVVIALSGILLLPGLIGAMATHPYQLSYYNGAVGFRGGAVDKGFNLLPWAQVDKEFLDQLEQKYPNGMNIDINSGAATILRGYQALGMLSPKFTFNKNGNYWVICSNYAFSGFERWWLLHEGVDPQYELADFSQDNGFRYVSVYKRRGQKPSAQPKTKKKPTLLYMQKP